VRRISSTEVFRGVPRAPRWSRPRHALVHRIGPTRRTSPGRVRQALLICLKPAIRGSSPPSIVNDAPRTIGRSGFLKADDGGKHTEDEQENSHGNLQSRSGLSRQNSKISGSQTQIAIQLFYSRIRDGPPHQQQDRASNKKKFQKSQKVFISNLPLTFAIVRLPSSKISFRKATRVLGPGEFRQGLFFALAYVYFEGESGRRIGSQAAHAQRGQADRALAMSSTKGRDVKRLINGASAGDYRNRL
jgi:hypothetical protein